MKTRTTMRAVDLLKNKFGVSQLYKYDLIQHGSNPAEDEVVLTIFWHPLTIAERESIQSKAKADDTADFALSLMIEKALDAKGKRLFADGDKAVLRREINSAVLQEIQLEMLNSGAENKVEEAKADLKSEE